MSDLAGIVLKNSMEYDEQVTFHNILRSSLKVSVSLYLGYTIVLNVGNEESKETHLLSEI